MCHCVKASSSLSSSHHMSSSFSRFFVLVSSHLSVLLRSQRRCCSCPRRSSISIQKQRLKSSGALKPIKWLLSLPVSKLRLRRLRCLGLAMFCQLRKVIRKSCDGHVLVTGWSCTMPKGQRTKEVMGKLSSSTSWQVPNLDDRIALWQVLRKNEALANISEGTSKL